MKVGVTVRLYNFEMKNRRAELGLTQKQLSDASGVNFNAVGEYERLQLPSTKRIGIIEQHLNRIAAFLDMPFDELFPPDYLEMIKEKKLRKSSRFEWIQEVSLDQLPRPGDLPLLEVDSAEIVAEQGLMDEWARAEIDKAINVLSPRERFVIEYRFGLGKYKHGHTLEETSKQIPYEDSFGKRGTDIFGRSTISRERVRQIEAKALRKFRHPTRSRHLKAYFDASRGIPADHQTAYDKQDLILGMRRAMGELSHLADPKPPQEFIPIPIRRGPADDMHTCPLDEVRNDKRFELLYDHPVFGIYVCGLCGFPVVIYSEHSIDPSDTEVNLMLKALMFLAEKLWHQRGQRIGIEHSTHSPKFLFHWNAHATWFHKPLLSCSDPERI